MTRTVPARRRTTLAAAVAAVSLAITAAAPALSAPGNGNGNGNGSASQGQARSNDLSATRGNKVNDAAALAPHLVGQTLDWDACDFGSERLNARFNAIPGTACADVTVPRDWKNPEDGHTITLRVAKTETSKGNPDRQGIALVNPGGPGGSGLSLSRLGGWVPDNAGAGYDWIGFDPRGVGSSVPALSCDPDFFAPNRPYYSPNNTERLRAWTAKTRQYASDCGAANAERLPHMRSSNTVYDMESIRKALGRWKLNFYGFSYGTHIAQIYASKYPHRVRRFVLDGVVNTGKSWYDANLDQNLAFEESMRAWWEWIAENDDTYGLGTTGAEVRREWYRQRARLANWPREGMGPSEWTDVFLSAGYYVYDWDYLASVFVAASQDSDFGPAIDEYASANPSEPGSDNGYATYLATECTDSPWPASWAQWSKDGWRTHRAAPFESWGNMWFNNPCRVWPTDSGPRVYVNGSKAPAMLLIAETKDAATPFSGALATRQRFPKSVLIEGKDGSTHSGSLSGVDCVDDRVAAYLKSGTLPSRQAGNTSDVECEPVPPPTPTSPDARAAQSKGLENRELREIINEARAF